MILHAFTAAIPKNHSRPFTYWAIHGPTLTPVRINIGPGGRTTLDIILHPPDETPVYLTHPQHQATPAAIAQEVMASITSANPRYTHQKTRSLTRHEVTVPEYLLVFEVDGTHPAIARTQDPHFVIPINEKLQMLHTEHSFVRTITDLSALGWCYWWQDAQAAYETLAPELIAAVKG